MFVGVAPSIGQMMISADADENSGALVPPRGAGEERSGDLGDEGDAHDRFPFRFGRATFGASFA